MSGFAFLLGDAKFPLYEQIGLAFGPTAAKAKGAKELNNVTSAAGIIFMVNLIFLKNNYSKLGHLVAQTGRRILP
jgi:hypothetical protein